MIFISYTPPDELEISGTTQDLKGVLTRLESLANGDQMEVFIEADKNANPAPYDEGLNALIARVTAGPTKVSVFGGHVEVVGSQASFDRFASFFQFDEHVSIGEHHHHEYYTGDSYIHPDSVPLVIGIRRES
jgi:hypothetical protein